MQSAQNKCAVIYGGSGFIGYHLSQYLLDKNFRVVIADLVPPSRLIEGVEFVLTDVRYPVALEDLPSDTYVFNLAAIHRSPGHKEDEYYETNVLGTVNVLNWCLANSIERYFFMSSIAVYGNSFECMEEDSQLNPKSSYGISKKIAEDISTSIYNQSPDSFKTFVICRPAVIFGKGECGNFTRMLNGLRRGLFPIPNSSKFIKSSGYVKDLIRSIEFVMNSHSSFIIYNYAFPTSQSLIEIGTGISRTMGYRKPIQFPIEKVTVLLRRFNLEKFNWYGRFLKVTLPTNISTNYLAGMGFSWEHDLHTAIIDWRRDLDKEGITTWL